jgi:hypothetical protein
MQRDHQEGQLSKGDTMGKLKEELGVPITSAVEELNMLLDKYEWFYNATIENDVIIAYVERMNEEVFHFVPKHCYGHDVKLRFRSYLECEEKYTTPITLEALREMN